MLLALWAFVALVLIWGAYPLVIGALSRRPLAQWRLPSTPPRVTVVIATRDDAEAVKRRVDDCRQAAYDGPLDVVVAVDAAARLDAGQLALEGAGVTVVRGDGPGGKAAALNAGVRAATGQILVFTDTHQRFTAGTIAELVIALQDPKVGAVSGALELRRHAGGPSLVERYWSMERWLREREARLHSCIGVTGAVWAMRRTLWTPLPPGLILDDVFTPMRLVLDGHRVAFAARARATETRTSPPGQEYRRKVRTLTGVLQLCAWMPALVIPWRNPVWGQFVAHKLLRMVTPYLLIAIGAGVLQVLASAIGVAAAATVAATPVLIACIPRPHGLPHMLREAVLMQTAAIVAALNGARGRWEVWSAHPRPAGAALAVPAIPITNADGLPSTDR